MSKTIVWFRNDLRLAENPALHAAAERGEIIPLYILDDEAAGDWKVGAAKRWWLHQSLESLGNSIRQHHSHLVLRKGDSQKILTELLEKTGADAVYWNRRYDKAGVEQDKHIKEELKDREIEVKSFKASLLFEPWEVQTKEGEYYKVFSPFWRACLKEEAPAEPLEVPAFTQNDHSNLSEALADWDLCPTKPNWAENWLDIWQPGEAGAQARLEKFLEEGANHYAGGRDIPSKPYVSNLSPHLASGEISPRQIWHATKFAQANGGLSEKNADKFLSEVGWREFSYTLLYYNPEFPDTAYKENFNQFPWEENDEALKRWQKGQTGYPMVDAGMRELWHTGVMHNRVRMIVASFLTKHLLLPWQAGERWFWDTLVDADLANNSASWQWVAGCGADAAPYFRIFNPILQGKRYDEEGDYIRKWVPELAHLSDKDLHEPWNSSNPPANYPAPIVEHQYARDRAMEAYKVVKKVA